MSAQAATERVAAKIKGVVHALSAALVHSCDPEVVHIGICLPRGLHTFLLQTVPCDVFTPKLNLLVIVVGIRDPPVSLFVECVRSDGGGELGSEVVRGERHLVKIHDDDRNTGVQRCGGQTTGCRLAIHTGSLSRGAAAFLRVQRSHLCRSKGGAEPSTRQKK